MEANNQDMPSPQLDEEENEERMEENEEAQTQAYVRRESRPANEQRLAGNPEEQKEGPEAVTVYDGEYVEARDFVTSSESARTPEAVEEDMEETEEVLDETDSDVEDEDAFECDEDGCGRSFNTERGLAAHQRVAHADEEEEDSDNG